MSELRQPALEIEGLCKSYNRGMPGEVDVLRGVDLRLMPGEAVALMAPSGSGKSTLLHLAGLLDTADAGVIRICGEDFARASDRARTRARAGRIGFVYQAHHLLPEFTALENVVLAQLACGTPAPEAEARARALLVRVGLLRRAAHRPAELSGGEQQRVALCRALACKPDLLIADEPTGNLDRARSSEVFEMLLELARAEGVAALVATHDPDLANSLDRRVRLEEGRLI